MSKVNGFMIIEILIFLAILAGVYSVIINILPPHKPSATVKSAIEQLNKTIKELVALSIEKQATSRILFMVKDEKVHCFAQLYNGTALQNTESKSLTFEKEAASMFKNDKKHPKEFAIEIDSNGVVRPLHVKLLFVNDNDRNNQNEVILDWLSSRLVIKKQKAEGLHSPA